MKLSFDFKKKMAGLEADVEGLVSKKMDIDAARPPKPSRRQIREEEKRKTMEMKHKQEMQKVYLAIGIGVPLFVVLLALCIVMAILESNGIV